MKIVAACGTEKLCAMKTEGRFPLLLLTLIYIILPAVPEAQDIRVWPEVIGYLGRDVTLPCQFIKGPSDSFFNQVQWDLLPPDGKKIPIIVSNIKYGDYIANTTLKGRVDIADSSKGDHSLIIRDVKMADGGRYTCSIATFPSGSFEGTTTLIVLDQAPLSQGVVAGIVIAVMLLLVITVATVYLIIARMRRSGLVNHNSICIDIDGPMVDMAWTREEDLVYSDITFKPPRSRNSIISAPLTNDKHTESTHADDVTYSEVVVGHRHPR
uniref:myelin protein P0-like isoform X1 n=2 Tax=Centroberyx gerrardi TaxID=166262 RepID=UPI003AAAFB0A